MKILAWLKNFYGELTHSEVIVQANLSDIAPVFDIAPLTIRKIDPQNSYQVNEWLQVVNDAYNEYPYNIESARNLLTQHHFIDNVETYLVYDSEIAVAGISLGVYREMPSVGGVFRIAVKKSHQGLKLGRFVILYAYHKLHENGIEIGESVISSYRQKSILVHLSCGFRPQTDISKIAHKTVNFNKNFVQRYRALRAIKKAMKVYREKSKK